MRKLLLLILILSLTANLADGRATKKLDRIEIYYDDYTVEGKGVQISLRVNLNLSYLEITFNRDDIDPFTVYGAKFSTFIPGDYIDVDVDPQYLSAGVYEVRLLAKQQQVGNSSLPVVSTFFTITVQRVLQGFEVVVTIVILSLTLIFPFFYEKDKRRLELKSWNVITFRRWLSIRFSFLKSWKFWLVFVILVILTTAGGYYYVYEL